MPPRYQPLGVREGMQRRINDMESAEHTPAAWERIQNKEAFKKEKVDLKKRLDAAL